MIAHAQVRGSRSSEGTVTPGGTQSATKPQQQKSQSIDGLFTVFILAAIVWMGFAAVLVYHFRKYGKGDGRVQLAQALYIGGSLLLLLIALFALL